MKNSEALEHILNMSKDIEKLYKCLDKLHDFENTTAIDYSCNNSQNSFNNSQNLKHFYEKLDNSQNFKYLYEMLGREIYKKSKLLGKL